MFTFHIYIGIYIKKTQFCHKKPERNRLTELQRTKCLSGTERVQGVIQVVTDDKEGNRFALGLTGHEKMGFFD